MGKLYFCLQFTFLYKFTAGKTLADSITPWQGRRYFPISHYFKHQFGEKVGKISVSIAATCPNRQASKKSDICIFCDEWGSAAYPIKDDQSLLEQVRKNRIPVQKRLRAKKFLVYFQAYTSTLGHINKLKHSFDEALSEPDIIGAVIGTRPDCLPKRIFPLFKDISERHYLMVELGVQSFFDEHLDFLKRGHSAACSIDAVRKLHEHTGANIGIHLMFGLPDETDEHIIQTAKYVNMLPIDNVKLHNLHVLQQTPLADLYAQGKFQPLELEEYARRVILFLRHLSPLVSVQRLAAVANRWAELVAPQWTREKMQPILYIEDRMAKSGYMQGDCYDKLSIITY